MIMAMDVRKEVIEAEKRIRPYVMETPLEYSRYLSALGDCRVFLKLENVQRTGSFKFRGAANMMLSLTPEELRRGVITSSTGNHGAAFAEMVEILNSQNPGSAKGTIFLPETASEAKQKVMRSYDVKLSFHGTDTVDTEAHARTTAEKEQQVFVPPYNHEKIVGGQGTIGLELERQINKPDTVLVPVGGGGLASGIAGYMKETQSTKHTRMTGCLPEASPVMYESVKAGHIVEMDSLPTLSDGTAGGIEPGSITFDICRQYLDDYLLLTEKEIADAVRLILENHYMLIEGSAALPVAAFKKYIKRFKNQTVVLIISGKKITLEQLKKII